MRFMYARYSKMRRTETRQPRQKESHCAGNEGQVEKMVVRGEEDKVLPACKGEKLSMVI